MQICNKMDWCLFFQCERVEKSISFGRKKHFLASLHFSNIMQMFYVKVFMTKNKMSKLYIDVEIDAHQTIKHRTR